MVNKNPIYILKEVFDVEKAFVLGYNKEALLEYYKEKALKCRRCPLYKTRNRLVFGWGNPYSGVMAIGEAPGVDENRIGKPFVGKAGTFLAEAMEKAGIDRERDLYITNVLKCIPLAFPGSRKIRPPKKEEIRACSYFLEKQIQIIKPRLILAMGGFALSYLLQREVKITANIGQIFEIKDGIKVFPVFHPSKIIREDKEKVRKHYVEDLKKFKSLIEELKES